MLWEKHKKTWLKGRHQITLFSVLNKIHFWLHITKIYNAVWMDTVHTWAGVGQVRAGMLRSDHLKQQLCRPRSQWLMGPLCSIRVRKKAKLVSCSTLTPVQEGEKEKNHSNATAVWDSRRRTSSCWEIHTCSTNEGLFDYFHLKIKLLKWKMLRAPQKYKWSFGEKNSNHLTYNQFTADLWWIKHLVWTAAELLLTVRWKGFSVHATFPGLAYLNTRLLQWSA